MEKKNNSGILVGILIGIIIMLLVFIGLFATGNISFKSTSTGGNGQASNNIIENNMEEKPTNNTDSNTNNTLKYKGESFIGYYQILNSDYFSESKFVSGKYTSFNLEIKLSEDGTAKVAYKIDDQGHITEHQYDATYELIKTLDEQIDGDYYKSLQLTFTSKEANSDSNISFLERTTYNPASNPKDGSQSFAKSLVFKHGADSIIPRMVDESKIILLK